MQGEFFETPDEPIIDSEPEEAEAAPETEPSIPSPSRSIMKDLSIPKLYYSISEVSRLTGLEQYVLRYWETEFDELRPQKNRAGNRIYSNKDIKFILRIRELLREKRYTIEGAKQILKDDRVAVREAEKRGETIDEVSSESNVAPDPSQLPMISPNEVDAPLTNIASVTLTELGEIKARLRSLKVVLAGASR